MKPKPFPAPLLPWALGLLVLLWVACGSDPKPDDPQGAGASGPQTGHGPQAGSQKPTQQDKKPPKPDVRGAPKLTLRVSGYMAGRLTPCGCASGQMGGLPRRMFYLDADKNFDLLLEGGHMVAEATQLDLEKMSTAMEVLSQAHYHGLGIAAKDLQLPYNDLAGYLTGYTVPVLTADLRPKPAKNGDQVPWPGKPFVEHRGRQVTARIASLTLSLPRDGAGKHFELRKPEDAWALAMQGVADSTYRILMVHGNRHKAKEMTKLVPKPDLVICVSNDFVEPPGSEDYGNGVPVVWTGIRGRMLLDITLARGKQGPAITSYQVIKLSGSKTVPGAKEHKNAKAVVRAHRDMVKDLKLREKLANRFETANGARFVGSAACKGCHEKDYAAWQETRHATAWETLETHEKNKTKYDWPITHYPDCVKCHTVGYYQKSGFVTPETTPGLKGVGCEECHGAGSLHVQDPQKHKLETLRGMAGPKKCVQCHDFEQSPNFDYNKKWLAIRHGKK